MGRGYGPGFTEWDAAEQLTAYRARQPLFAGLAYENISATGANAGEHVKSIIWGSGTRRLTNHFMLCSSAALLYREKHSCIDWQTRRVLE